MVESIQLIGLGGYAIPAAIVYVLRVSQVSNALNVPGGICRESDLVDHLVYHDVPELLLCIVLEVSHLDLH